MLKRRLSRITNSFNLHYSGSGYTCGVPSRKERNVSSTEQVASLAADLHTQPNFRWWLTEFIAPQVLQYMQKAWEKQLAAGNVSIQFASENSEAFYQEYGWKLAEFRSAIEEAHRLRREMPFAWLLRSLAHFYSKERQEYYRKMSGYALLERE